MCALAQLSRSSGSADDEMCVTGPRCRPGVYWHALERRCRRVPPLATGRQSLPNDRGSIADRALGSLRIHCQCIIFLLRRMHGSLSHCFCFGLPCPISSPGAGVGPQRPATLDANHCRPRPEAIHEQALTYGLLARTTRLHLVATECDWGPGNDQGRNTSPGKPPCLLWRPLLDINSEDRGESLVVRPAWGHPWSTTLD